MLDPSLEEPGAPGSSRLVEDVEDRVLRAAGFIEQVETGNCALIYSHILGGFQNVDPGHKFSLSRMT